MTHNPIWWYLARATGLVAWALASAAVLWGLALSTRALGRRPGPKWLLDLHGYLGTLTLAFTGAHVLALLADSQVQFRVVDVLVPFTAAWRPAAVGLGVLALWGLAAVQASSLLRKRLATATWRKIHRLSFVVFVAATGHFLAAGSDIERAWAQWLVLAVLGATVFLVAMRRLTLRRRVHRDRPGGDRRGGAVAVHGP